MLFVDWAVAQRSGLKQLLGDLAGLLATMLHGLRCTATSASQYGNAVRPSLTLAGNGQGLILVACGPYTLFVQPGFTDTEISHLQAAFNRLWRRAFNKKFKKGGDDDNIVQFLMPEVTANVSSCKAG